VIQTTTTVGLEVGRGVYDAYRAAALAGVPVSTLHYWARHSIYTPSISPEPRVRYWSWMDLLALRMIDWLRRDDGAGGKPRIPISRIRQALHQYGGAWNRPGEVPPISCADNRW
jgi:DNA-binding transcriptional MerR regulator